MALRRSPGVPPRGAPATALQRAVRAERTMVRVRWAAVVFGIVQVVTYYLPYPPGVRPMALGIVAALAAGNVVVAIGLRRVSDLRSAHRLEVASLVLDGVIVMGFVFVYTFDPDTAIWALVYILPLEGAIRFGLPGALLTMAAATLVYTAREAYGQTVYDNPLLPTSISFRMGIGFIIAGVAGAMASSLERDRSALEEAKAALERYTADLQAANTELHAANEVKDDFLAMTNHELRTPLTTILGYTALLLQRWDALDEERRKEAIRWVDHQGRRLHALVEDLLTLSSAQAGALDVDIGPVDVCEVVTEAIQANGVTAGGVENRCTPGVAVRADFNRLTQIVANFVSNALKYGRPPVSVEIRESPDSVEIWVCDAGAGVPESFVPRLFDKFSQASSGASRTSEGTGLGLAIARRLAQAQGAEVFYEPNDPVGSRFCVRLRRA